MRIIAKLDVKPPYVVKPVHFEGLRKIGTPETLAKKYFLDGADEIVYIDMVASLYQREILYEQIKKTAEALFVPFAVGGVASLSTPVLENVLDNMGKIKSNTVKLK